MNRKKLLAVLLCLVMIASMLPVSAMAEESIPEVAENETAELQQEIATESEEPVSEEAEAVETEPEATEPEQPVEEPVADVPEANAVEEPSEPVEPAAEEAVETAEPTIGETEPEVAAQEEAAVIEEAQPEPAAQEQGEITKDPPEEEKSEFVPDEVEPIAELLSTGGVTRDAAVAWAQAQIGKALDYDGVYGAQCVDLIYYYYQALGQTVLGGNAIDYASNALPAGWQRITYSAGVTAQPGDIAVWSGWENEYGHVAIVESADDSAMNVIEQNFNYIQTVQKNWTAYDSGRYATLVCFIRPDFSTNQLPKGYVDSIWGTSNGSIFISGWAYDPDDTGNNSLELDVYTMNDGYNGGKRYVTYTNGKYRPDVVNAYGNVGNYHGFEVEVPVNERGNQPVYVYAIDTSDPSQNTLIYNGGTVNIPNPTITINYDANGGSGAPAQTVSNTTPITLSSTTPTRADETKTVTYTLRVYHEDGQRSEQKIATTKTIKYTFENWNTAADGSGTSYNAGAKYSESKSTTLYAQWTSSSTTTPAKLPTPTRNNCVFKYWEIDQYPYSTYTDSCNYPRDAVLTAQWQMTLHYNANGGTNAPADDITIIGNKYTKSVSSVQPTRADESGTYMVSFNANGGTSPVGAFYTTWSAKYSFKNWNTAANGSGSSYNPGDSITGTSSITLYAQWNADKNTTAVDLPTPTRDGYSFMGWGTSATATTGVTGSYTPTGNVTLYAIWKSNSPSGQTRFDDVSDPTAYYYTPVYWAVDNGITSGTSATTFSPNNSCTRGQVMAFLYKAKGSPAVSGSNPFTDVKESDYFYNAVLWAVANGITSGTSATTFSPYKTCTRAQVMTFLYKAMGSPAVSGSNPFTDVKTSDYFYNAVLWAVANGITNGTSATTFSPYNTCTRAQVMTFLYKAMN